ncbi:mediator of RNA polymerase II transcription subunit 8 [Didymella sp. IMI 355093]|nr:mediator of RNA polymerase II transcription subunit 8 [Didymella sp. IMI 355093]
MNQNFVGQPNAEDIKALENLRRGLIPMLAALNKLKYDMEDARVRGTAVDWPQIQRTTSTVNSYITTLMTTINGGRRYTLENRKTDAGKILKSKQGDSRRDYRDIDIEPQADTIRNLHPFPTAPFDGTNDHFNMIVQGLLRKRVEPEEEKWVEERLQKALEFASVPPEWGIEPRKPTADKDDKDSDIDTESEVPSTAVHRFSKRAEGVLTEDQLVQRWNSAHMWFFNPPRTDFDEEGEYEEGEEGEEDEDEGEFEDAMNTPAADAGAQPPQEDAQSAKPPPAVVMMQEAEPPVHKPVPGMPVLDLGVIQKFMATGQL